MEIERTAGMMPQGFEVIDPGHQYRLGTLDGELAQLLTFVKRTDPAHPEKYPGNTSSYPGTTLQCVIRVLIDRVRYLDGQHHDDRNDAVILNLKRCLVALESRAAERHGRALPMSYLDHPTQVENYVTNEPMCAKCGHVGCTHQTNHAPAETEV